MNTTTDTRTMTAWQQDRYGGPETVTRRTAPRPAPGRGEVLLRIRAAGVNAGDVRLMRGEPRLVRLFFGLTRPRVRGRGMDAAGTVVAIGAEVDGFAVGDEVIGELPGGAFADFAVAPAARLVHRPAGLDAVAAAALPIAGVTAWLACDSARVASGHRVLVIGASGGVGTYAVQLAALRGAEVWALTGARSQELVRGLGAAEVFDYHEVQPGDPRLPDGTFDAVIDIAGNAPLGRLKALLRKGGCLVSVAGGGDGWLGPIPRLLWGALSWIGSGRRFAPLAASPKPEVLAELAGLAASDRLSPVIERTWPLSEADAALAHVDAGHTLGKVVVCVE